MKASFIHVADTHLGNEQYGKRERFIDFSRAFWDIMDEAAQYPVDFVVIAGDLFNKRAIDAMTLIHAIEGLKKLRDKGIPVIAIEGNHDRSYYRDGVSWLQFLCHQGYLKLLSPIMRDGAPIITPWQQEDMRGSHVDVMNGRLRIYGLPWQGASTVKSMEGLAAALRNVREEDAAGIQYRLLMLHTGVEGIVPRTQGLPSMSHFQPLHSSIDYLALGHIHKPYEFEGWMYNPGSTETCGAEEASWEDRGYYFVQIDTDAPETLIDPEKEARFHLATHKKSNRRPYVRHELRVDGLNEPEALYERLEDYCRREGPKYRNETRPPVVQIHLIGTLGFDSGSLDRQRMEEMVSDYFNALFVRVDNNTNDQDYVPEGDDLDGRDRSAWHELERRIFEELVSRDNRYLANKEQWSVVLADLKQMALDKNAPADIAQFLRDKRALLL